jgi:glycerol-3-phosphate acyltransferase PlsY
VATFFGIMLTAAWPVGVAAAVTWLAIAAIFRWSSLAGLTAAVLAPVYAVLFHQRPAILILALFTAVLVVYRHEQNIRRLIGGEEPKIGAKKA